MDAWSSEQPIARTRTAEFMASVYRWMAFGLALTFDAVGGIGQGIEAGHGNGRPAAFTSAELPGPHPL